MKFWCDRCNKEVSTTGEHKIKEFLLKYEFIDSESDYSEWKLREWVIEFRCCIASMIENLFEEEKVMEFAYLRDKYVRLNYKELLENEK